MLGILICVSHTIKTREYEFIVLSRVFIHKNRFSDASLLLNRLLCLYEKLKIPRGIVETTNLLAILAYRRLNEETAINYLEKSLSVGMEEGYVRSYVDELSPMVSLLELYIENHKKEDRITAYVRKLL